jgi:two-component system chemotaxis response regulator CheY
LVVDDFPSMRKLLLKSLRQMGMVNLLEASDGIQAVEILESDRVDMLVSDWNMPDMGGLELLRWVRKKYTEVRLPFLMVTTKGQAMDVVQAVKAGVDAYIVKPFTQDGLEAKVINLVPMASEFAAARAAAKLAAAEKAEADWQARRELLLPPEEDAGEGESPQASETTPSQSNDNTD